MKAKASPNIAFIKYWGKREFSKDEERNIGLNASLSMTLSKAQTVAEIKKLSDAVADEIWVNSEPAKDQDQEKVSQHLDRVFKALDKKRVNCVVHSSNNFPTGAGIASSSSAFAALTLACVGELLGADSANEMLQKKPTFLSEIARQGSGSAARSIEGPFCFWDGPFATKIPDAQWKLYDTVVIFDATHKKVSSRQGHEAVHSSPRMKSRLEKVGTRTERVKESILAEDLKKLGPLIEEDALEMHEVMESSVPPIVYRDESCLRFLSFIEALPERDFFWTLDAGPNPHLISERPIGAEIKRILGELELDATIWEDEGGLGCQLL